MRLTYSRKNTMRLLVERIKIFNLIRPHQISQVSHFRIKYEYLVSHLKEKISRHAFFFLSFSLYPFVAFAILSSFKYDLIIFPKRVENI